MRLALYGGSFNPPHPAHVRAARLAYEALCPDKLIVMPAADPPHKQLAENSPCAEERLELTRIAFSELPEAEVSDMELRRSGESYTADTVRQLQRLYPGAEITLVLGADMLLYFEKWREHRWLLENVTLAALSREEGDRAEMEQYAERLRRDYAAHIAILPAAALPMSSSELRARLISRQGAELLAPAVYARVIRQRDYGAKPQLSWLREQVAPYMKPARIPHVLGCEAEAGRLAQRWGADPEDAAEAGILHDITKKLDMSEQLLLADRYGIIFDNVELGNLKLLHAATGAALSREQFGVPDDIYGAIRWHTTGRPEMTLLEKIIYLADYIEPTRDFPGVTELRRLAYEDIDAAMALGLRMSLEELRERGSAAHSITSAAYAWYGKDTRL